MKLSPSVGKEQMGFAICHQFVISPLHQPFVSSRIFRSLLFPQRRRSRRDCKLELSAGLRMDKVDFCFPLFVYKILKIIFYKKIIVLHISSTYIFGFFLYFHIFLPIFSRCLWQRNLSLRDNLASVSSNSLFKYYHWWWSWRWWW